MNCSKFWKVRFVANLVLAIGVVVFVASCDGNSQSEKQTQQKVEVMTPWQESLSAFMKNPMMNGDLLLCGYTMMGNLDSKESIQNYLDKCFDSKSYFLMFNSEWENKRDLGVQSDLASRNKFDESLFALHKEYVRGLLVGDGMSVVELRWSYKGKEFNTFAAVTNNEATPICYDNILTPYDPMTFKSVETRSIKGSGPTVIRGARPNIVKKKVTRTGIDGEEPVINTMEYYTVVRDDSVHIWSGTTLWSIDMKNISRFEIATGVFINSSLEKTNYPFYGGGSWACDGGISNTYGVWGISMSHEFEMGYGVSQGIPAYVYITPSRVGLTVQANHLVYRTGILRDIHIF